MICKGLVGLIFGHHYLPVYDTDHEYHNAEAVQKIIKLTQECNFWGTTLDHQRMDVEDLVFKRKTKIYQCHVCKRCGDIKKENIKI